MEDHEYRRMYAVEDTHWWFVGRRLFVSSLLHPPLSRKLRVVDIGAGTGGMMSFLTRYGSVLGIEPHPVGRKLAKKRGVKLKSGTATNTKLRAGSCDVVCLFDVLYHKGVDDVKALSEAYRILRPGGWLVITDCAVPLLYGPNDKAVAGRERYVLSHLVAKVRATGFHLQRQTYVFFFVFPLIAVKRLFDRWAGEGRRHSDVGNVNRIVNAALTALCRGEASLLPFVSFPIGSSVAVIARK